MNSGLILILFSWFGAGYCNILEKANVSKDGWHLITKDRIPEDWKTAVTFDKKNALNLRGFYFFDGAGAIDTFVDFSSTKTFKFQICLEQVTCQGAGRRRFLFCYGVKGQYVESDCPSEMDGIGFSYKNDKLIVAGKSKTNVTLDKDSCQTFSMKWSFGKAELIVPSSDNVEIIPPHFLKQSAKTSVVQTKFSAIFYEEDCGLVFKSEQVSFAIKGDPAKVFSKKDSTVPLPLIATSAFFYFQIVYIVVVGLCTTTNLVFSAYFLLIPVRLPKAPTVESEKSQQQSEVLEVKETKKKTNSGADVLSGVVSAVTAMPPPTGLRAMKTVDELFRLALTADVRAEREVYLDAAIEGAQEEIKAWEKSPAGKKEDETVLSLVSKRILAAKRRNLRMMASKDPSIFVLEQVEGFDAEEVTDLALIQNDKVRHAVFERAYEMTKKTYETAYAKCQLDKELMDPLVYQFQLGITELDEEDPEMKSKRRKLVAELAKNRGPEVKLVEKSLDVVLDDPKIPLKP